MADGLSELYQDLLTGNCDGVDRIVLNAYFRQDITPAASGGKSSRALKKLWTMRI